MKIGIVDYEGGNLASVARAVETLGFSPYITSDAKVLRSSDKVIFPGVGAAGATMKALRQADLVDCLTRQLQEQNIPCLGICIGIQVLFEHSEEDNQDTLGILKGQVKKFPAGVGLKIPHIGWNQVEFTRLDHPLLEGVQQNDFFYFVNSFYVEPKDTSVILGSTTYGPIKFTTLVESGNWTASQFHLEKSGESGLKLLKNFLSH
jgi:imidazole glycerol-phosphate synthase subunit HisH